MLNIQSSEHTTSLGCFSDVKPIENCAPPVLPVFLISNYSIIAKTKHQCNVQLYYVSFQPYTQTQTQTQIQR